MVVDHGFPKPALIRYGQVGLENLQRIHLVFRKLFCQLFPRRIAKNIPVLFNQCNPTLG
jgi:hypothetical protein